MLSRSRPGEPTLTPDVLRDVHGRPWVVAAVDLVRGPLGGADVTVAVAAPSVVCDEVGSVIRSAHPSATVLVVPAGATLHASLHAVLDATTSWADTTPVVLHDVGRPLASEALAAAVVDASAAGAQAVVPTLPLVETVKAVADDGRILRTLDRDGLLRVQTPQAASLRLVRAAHAGCRPPHAERPDLVGDAGSVRVVPGEHRADVVASGPDGDAYVAAWRG